MSEDYASAASRHWEDAEILFRAGRFDNAAYLSGYVVECALKILIQKGRADPSSLWHDLPALAGDALLLACLMVPSIRRYPLPRSADFEDLKRNWKSDMRYWPTGQVTESTAQRWLRASEEAYRAVVIEAVLDGRSGLL
jgi:HEPN domain-containing protein